MSFRRWKSAAANDHTHSHSLTVSYMEIYNRTINWFLDNIPRTNGPPGPPSTTNGGTSTNGGVSGCVVSQKVGVMAGKAGRTAAYSIKAESDMQQGRRESQEGRDTSDNNDDQGEVGSVDRGGEIVSVWLLARTLPDEFFRRIHARLVIELGGQATSGEEDEDDDTNDDDDDTTTTDGDDCDDDGGDGGGGGGSNLITDPDQATILIIGGGLTNQKDRRMRERGADRASRANGVRDGATEQRNNDRLTKTGSRGGEDRREADPNLRVTQIVEERMVQLAHFEERREHTARGLDGAVSEFAAFEVRALKEWRKAARKYKGTKETPGTMGMNGPNAARGAHVQGARGTGRATNGMSGMTGTDGSGTGGIGGNSCNGKTRVGRAPKDGKY